jgi:hypothetical protein
MNIFERETTAFSGRKRLGLRRGSRCRKTSCTRGIHSPRTHIFQTPRLNVLTFTTAYFFVVSVLLNRASHCIGQSDCVNAFEEPFGVILHPLQSPLTLGLRPTFLLSLTNHWDFPRPTSGLTSGNLRFASGIAGTACFLQRLRPDQPLL